MATATKMRRGYRKIHLPQGIFQYKVGRGYVKLYDPWGGYACVANHTLKGLEPHVFEKGRWKKTQDGQVAPSEVKAWIEAQQ